MPCFASSFNYSADPLLFRPQLRRLFCCRIILSPIEGTVYGSSDAVHLLFECQLQRQVVHIGVRLPSFLGGIPLSYLVLGGILQYRPRVLDAWVNSHIATSRKCFEKKRTIEQRRFHVDLPALLEGKALSAVRPEDLRWCFESERIYVLISGEGGAGKTSLACQICKWAMNADPKLRLTKHVMLPIFLEHQHIDVEEKKDALMESIAAELWYIIGTPEAPSLALVEQLLKSRRILLVVDGFSEMTEAKRNTIQPGKPDFPGRAMLLTSRLDERLPSVDLTVLRPMRVQGDHLSTFMEAYLVLRNKKVLFSDVEYFDYLRRLSLLVQGRDITVLLAKLYADQVVAVKEGISRQTLPENVPDLMLDYLNELNVKVGKKRIDDKLMHRAGKIVAWECLKQTFRSMPASVDRVEKELQCISGDSSQLLEFLESELRIVQTVGSGRDMINFTLDPLAEYLASLWLVETFGPDERVWQTVLAEMDASPGAPDTIAGFILALRDCCTVKGKDFRVPTFVANELSVRISQ